MLCIKFGLPAVVWLLVVAALKTYLVVQLAMPQGGTEWAVISGLFALFFALTATVAYVSYTQLRSYLEKQRKEKLVLGAGESVAKETVILRHANDWGLSQAEADVAISVVKGFSNSEVVEMRGSAVTTVKSQLGRIYQESGLESRYQLVAFVTDEVCPMAETSEPVKMQRKTRNALSYVGRNQAAA